MIKGLLPSGGPICRSYNTSPHGELRLHGRQSQAGREHGAEVRACARTRGAFARVPLELENSGISYFRIAPNFRAPFGHTHSEQEEIYLVVAGSARVKLDDDVVDMGEWDAVRIPRGTMRAVEGGPEGAEVIAFGAPSHENRDVEMVQNWWSD
jgi:mannose-6-phosphate isomerase-like protein (cupin superfamily)